MPLKKPITSTSAISQTYLLPEKERKYQRKQLYLVMANKR